MDETPEEINRQVVPRWRQLSRTHPVEISSFERPDSTWQGAIDSRLDKEAKESHARWLEDRSLASAIDLIAAAIGTDKEQLAVGAARQVLAENANATPAARRVAERLVSGGPFAGIEFGLAGNQAEAQIEATRLRLGQIRRSLREYPRNALLYVEAARLYSILGQKSQAADAMQRATYIAPNSRFVLRSAARLFVHEGDPRRAHRLVRRSEATPTDPWLLSAEIALSTLSEMPPRFVAQARRAIGSDLPPVHISELAAAFGTVEMLSGASKNAKKLFKKSLTDPTDNSVAQVRWAAQMLNMPFEQRFLDMQGTFEARAENAHFRGASGQEVIAHTRLWWQDEPFSARPLILGSYTATTRLHCYELGLTFASMGLIANPTNMLLLNNKIVALAKLARVAEAESELQRIPANLFDSDPVLHATAGLVLFRGGHYERGREQYFKAIQMAREARNKSVELRARAHLLEEELLVGGLDDSNVIVTLHEDFAKTKDRHLGTFWREALEHTLEVSRNGGDTSQKAVPVIETLLSMVPPAGGQDVAPANVTADAPPPSTPTRSPA